MPMINGMWVDDSTGVPDQGMPPGMGDPTGGIVPPGGPAPMMTPPPPQQINPRPIPGATPSGVSPQMQTLMNPAAAGIEPGSVSPELTPGMVNQEWNKINRPPEWDAGRIATTIAALPATIPLQLVESIRGLFGGDTIQGWKEQADARYSNPNYSESRAFGVTGVAKEPDYGDRWTGIITGRSQQGAMAGKLMRNEIGRYSKQRSEELKNFKYVGDIYGKGQELQTNQLNLDFLPQKQQFERDRNRRAQEQLELNRRSSGATATLAEMRAKKMREDAAKAAVLAGRFKGDPQLAMDPAALVQAAGGDPDLANKVITATKGMYEIPDPTTGLARGPQTEFDAAEEARKATAARALETEARLEAAAIAETRNRAPQRNADVDVLRAKRDPVGPNWDTLQEILGQVTGGTLGVPTQAQDFYDYDADTRRFQAEAYRSRGLAVPANLVSPTTSPAVVPTPTPSALVDRVGTMSPEAKAAEIAQRDADASVAPAVPSLRPTPMATPRPSPSKWVDLMTAPPEVTRAADAKNEAELRADFNSRFWEPFAGRTAAKSGPLYESKWQGYLRKYNR
jgi:hypothetical protein